MSAHSTSTSKRVEALVLQAKQSDETAIAELCDIAQPATVTELIEVIYPHGLYSTGRFEALYDGFAAWRDHRLTKA